MSMVEVYEVVCSNCGRKHVTMATGHIDCPHCEKRWNIENIKKLTLKTGE